MNDIGDITPAEGQGFQFPGQFEITAMGNATANLDKHVPVLLQAIGLTVLHETVALKQSSGGTYASVTVTFECPDRKTYDEAHSVLRADPDIRFTL